MKSAWQRLFPILFLFGLTVLFFIPYLNGRSIPYAGDFTGSDLTELDLPLRFLAADQIRAGQMPLWTDLLANGFPLLAEGQAGVFYPLNLLFVFLPFIWAVNLSFFLNFFLAGVFIYLYCRVLKISRPGALFAALAFSFSGFFVFRLKHLNLINVAVWLPLTFYLIEKYFTPSRQNVKAETDNNSFINNPKDCLKPLSVAGETGFLAGRNKINWLLGLSAVYAVQLFAGFPPILYVSLVSGFAYFCLKIFFQEKFSLKKTVKKIVLPWVFIGAVFFGLAAIQLLPTFSFSGFSGRSRAMSYFNITAYPYPLANLLYFIRPYIFGNPAVDTFVNNFKAYGIFWENNVYFGLLPLFFAVFGLIFLLRKNQTVRILAILLLLAFFFVFGDLNPLFYWFWQYLPGLKMFRFPQRFLLLALLSLTVVAGFGFDFFWQKLSGWAKNLKSKMLFTFLLPLIFILIAAVDLFVVGFKYLGVLDYQAYFSPPQSAEFFKEDPEIFRIYSFNWHQIWPKIYQLAGGWQNNMSLFIAGREMVWPNLNVFWGLASAQDRASWEGGLLIKEIEEINNRLLLDSRLLKPQDFGLAVADEALKVFGLQNVKYFLSFQELNNPNLTLVKEINLDFLESLKIYRNKFFLPLTFGVFEAKPVNSADRALAALFEPNFSPAGQVLLAPDLIASNPAGQPSSARAVTEIADKKPGQITINADFSHDGYLVLSQPYLPGWQARLDGKKAEILRADYAFSAVALPAGKHQVIFEFRPKSYLIGRGLSLLTALVLLVYLVYYLVRNKFQSKYEKLA